MVVEFEVREGGNVHLRVREHLLDVFGFNITYEMIGRNESVRKDPCLFNHCSFTGSCVASALYDGYYCRCFADFFGSECQYNPGCEPSDSGGLCTNGGTCRYYIGSTVRSCECPSGFEGLRCQKRKNEHLPAHCVEMGCSQTCYAASVGEYRCNCFNGFTLAEDRKTCVEKGRTRYLVSFKLYDQNVDLAHLDSSRYNLLKKGIEGALLQLFEPKLYKAENLTVLSFQPGAVVQFHFFGEKEDSHQAKTVFEESLKRGRVGRYAVDKNYIRFEWEPALSIHGIEPSEKMPVVAGSELSLACILQGSSDMKVEWFKDSARIDVETSYRGIWTTLVPKNSKDQYTALLGFDKAHVLDTGEFTCKVTDWGTVQNRSIQVVVVTVPTPLLIPVTTTVLQGSPFVVTCLSEEDHYGNFGYNWLKNGRILNPSTEPEMIEDLFPSGSRLLVKDARASATYTCIITSTAGATRRDSVVTVLVDNGKIPYCHAEKYLEVKWGQTAANTEDVEACPKGYSGEVKRQCNLKKGFGGIWNKPDFSKCLSKEFGRIKEKFQSLCMGYHITQPGVLLQKVRTYLFNLKDRFPIAEGEPVVELLEGLHDYEKKQEKFREMQSKQQSQVFMDIASVLLDSRRLIQKQSYVIKLHQQILNRGLSHGLSVGGGVFHTFERPSVVLEVGQVSNEGEHSLRFPNRRLVRDTTGVTNSSEISWLTDSVELDFDTLLFENSQDTNDSISIAVVFYKNFSSFFPEHFVTRRGDLSVEYEMHSRLVAVAMQTAQKNAAVSPTRTPAQHLNVRAKLAHFNHTVDQRLMKNVTCGIADFSQGNIQFLFEGCQPILSGNYSLCQCNHFGTYAVLLASYSYSSHRYFHGEFEMIAGIGCALCAFLVLMTFLILIVLWRKIHGSITALKIQVCLALIGAYGAIISSLHESMRKEFYPYMVCIIQFFLLSAFCIQLCIGLTIYIEFVDLKGIRYPEFKLATLGWAVPVIVVGATLAAQVPEGFSLKSWWLELHTNHFYAYSSSALIMSVLHFLLVMTVKAELKCHRKLVPAKHARTTNRMKLLHRSLIIVFSLLLVSVSSILYINYSDDMFKYLFASSSGMLGFVVFLCYTVCSENALCSSEDYTNEEEIKQDPRLKGRRGSPQSFSKPEIVSDSCIGKFSESVEFDAMLDTSQELGYRLTPEGKVWKEMGPILLEQDKSAIPSSYIIRDFTVHHDQPVQVISRPKGIYSLTRCDSDGKFRTSTDPNYSHSTFKDLKKDREMDHDPSFFELQRLDGSPKSVHLQGSFEFNHPGTAPDILEPTNQQNCPSDGRHTAQNRNTAAEEQILIPGMSSRGCVMIPVHSKTVCSTFKPPDTHALRSLDVISHKNESVKLESPKRVGSAYDQKSNIQNSNSPCPPIQSMIGEDNLFTLDKLSDISEEARSGTVSRKDVRKSPTPNPGGLNIPVPQVPRSENDKPQAADTDGSAQQSKKGWSITTV